MTPDEYEALTAEIAGRIAAPHSAPPLTEYGLPLPSEALLHGRKSKVLGASGFEHQIDVQVRLPPKLWLIECKCWSKRVDPEAILAFLGRVIDIRDLEKEAGGQVHASMVTTKEFSKGARKIADYYRISPDIVRNESEFALKFWEHMTVGVSGVQATFGTTGR